jgi:glycosyltransferase involved in cell wall biosynthesis
MKILYVCNEYPPEPHGGLGVFLKNLAEGLVQKRHEVFIFGYYNRLNEPLIEKINGVNVIKYPIPFIEKGLLSHLLLRNSYSSDINKIVDSNEIDIVEFFDLGGYFLFMRFPFCVRLHNGSRYTKNKRSRLLTFFEIIAFITRKSVFIAVSDFHLKLFKKHLKILHPKSYLLTIKNSVKVLKTKTNKKNNKKIVFAGTLKHIKGIDLLIKAFIDGRFAQDGFTLEIYGPNTYIGNISFWEKLINTIKNLDKHIDAGWISYNGPLKQDLLHRAFQESYACVFPSRYESFGLVVVEAMALGCLVLYSDQGAASEFISHGVNGFLFKNGDFEDLIKKLNEVVNMSLNNQNVIRKNAVKKSKSFSFEHNINKSLKLYEDILKNLI